MADCGPGMVTRGVRRGGRHGMSEGMTVSRKALVPRSSVRSAGMSAIRSSSTVRVSALTGSSFNASRSTLLAERCTSGMFAPS